MTRVINQPASAVQTHGTIPTAQVSVAWDGVAISTYTANTRLLSVSNISTQITRGGSSSFGSATVTLSDADGALRATIDTARIEQSKAAVYAFFHGATGAPSLLLEGRVSQPQWKDKDATLTFRIESVIEDVEIGFALEKSHVTSPNNEIGVGKVWPLVFGKPVHLPVPLVQTVPESRLTAPISFGHNVFSQRLWTRIDDDAEANGVGGDIIVPQQLNRLASVFSTIDPVPLTQLGKIHVEEGHKFPQGTSILLEINGVLFRGTMSGNIFTATEENVPKWSTVAIAARPTADPDHANPKVAWISDTSIDLAGHWVYKSYEVKPGTIDYLENQCIRQEGSKCWFKYPFEKIFPGATPLKDYYQTHNIPIGTAESEYGILEAGTTFTEVKKIPDHGLLIELEEFVRDAREKLQQRRRRVSRTGKRSFGALENMLNLLQFAKSSFWQAAEGATVREWDGTTRDTYVINAAPSAALHGVWALRDDGTGKDVLAPVPKTYYTKHLDESFAGSSVALVKMNRPLNSYTDQGWKRDRLYVTQTSTLSDNAAEIIEWLATDMGLTFQDNGVSSQVQAYPCNFAVTEKKNAMALIREIAWQSRIGLVMDTGQLKLTYLPQPPAVSLTVADNLIDFDRGGTSQTTSGMEKLVTQLKAEWKRTGNPLEEPRTLTMSTNTAEFGVRPQSHNIYIYNDFDLVEMTLQFWLNRWGNLWKVFNIPTYMDAMAAECYDTIAAILPSISHTLSGTLVAGVNINTFAGQVDLSLVSSLKAGETTESPTELWTPDPAVSPTDPAASMSEVNYFVLTNHSEDNDELAELKREIRKFQDSSFLFAQIVAIDADDISKVTVNVHRGGPFEDATETDKVIWDLNPWEDHEVGDWIAIKNGQDGMAYIDRKVTLEFPVEIIQQPIAGENNYTGIVKVFSGEDPNTVENYHANTDDSETKIQLYNLSHDAQNILDVGTIITAKWKATGQGTDKGWWYFDQGTSPATIDTLYKGDDVWIDIHQEPGGTDKVVYHKVYDGLEGEQSFIFPDFFDQLSFSVNTDGDLVMEYPVAKLDNAGHLVYQFAPGSKTFDTDFGGLSVQTDEWLDWSVAGAGYLLAHEDAQAPITDATTVDFATTSNSFTVTQQNFRYDAKGHYAEKLTGSDLTISAGDLIDFQATGNSVTVNHADPGIATDTYSVGTSSGSNSFTLNFYDLSVDSKGHITDSQNLPSVVLSGDGQYIKQNGPVTEHTENHFGTQNFTSSLTASGRLLTFTTAALSFDAAGHLNQSLIGQSNSVSIPHSELLGDTWLLVTNTLDGWKLDHKLSATGVEEKATLSFPASLSYSYRQPIIDEAGHVKELKTVTGDIPFDFDTYFKYSTDDWIDIEKIWDTYKFRHAPPQGIVNTYYIMDQVGATLRFASVETDEKGHVVEFSPEQQSFEIQGVTPEIEVQGVHAGVEVRHIGGTASAHDISGELSGTDLLLYHDTHTFSDTGHLMRVDVFIETVDMSGLATNLTGDYWINVTDLGNRNFQLSHTLGVPVTFGIEMQRRNYETVSFSYDEFMTDEAGHTIMTGEQLVSFKAIAGISGDTWILPTLQHNGNVDLAHKAGVAGQSELGMSFDKTTGKLNVTAKIPEFDLGGHNINFIDKTFDLDITGSIVDAGNAWIKVTNVGGVYSVWHEPPQAPRRPTLVQNGVVFTTNSVNITLSEQQYDEMGHLYSTVAYETKSISGDGTWITLVDGVVTHRTFLTASETFEPDFDIDISNGKVTLDLPVFDVDLAGHLNVGVETKEVSQTLPVWKLEGDPWISTTDTNGSWSLKHTTSFPAEQTMSQELMLSSTGQITYSKFALKVDEAGHITLLSSSVDNMQLPVWKITAGEMIEVADSSGDITISHMAPYVGDTTGGTFDIEVTVESNSLKVTYSEFRLDKFGHAHTVSTVSKILPLEAITFDRDTEFTGTLLRKKTQTAYVLASDAPSDWITVFETEPC